MRNSYKVKRQEDLFKEKKKKSQSYGPKLTLRESKLLHKEAASSAFMDRSHGRFQDTGW